MIDTSPRDMADLAVTILDALTMPWSEHSSTELRNQLRETAHSLLSAAMKANQEKNV